MINAGLDHQLAAVTQEAFWSAFRVVTSLREQDRKPPRKKIWLVQTGTQWLFDHVASFGPVGTYDWRIPEKILSGPKAWLAAWLQGLFDAEGCLNKNTVRIGTVNEVGMRQAQEALRSLDIESRWYVQKPLKKHWSVCYLLSVSGQAMLRRFSRLVGFRCARKVSGLTRLLDGYVRETTTRDETKRLADRVARLRQEGFAWNEVASRLDVSAEHARSAMRRHRPELVGPHGGRAARPEPLLPALVAFSRTLGEACVA